jgi:hypothetical protein
VEQFRCVEFFQPPEQRASPAEGDHQDAETDHDAERPKHDEDVRAVFGREGVQPFKLCARVARDDPASGAGDRDLEMVFPASLIGNGEKHRGLTFLGLPPAFHGGDFRRLVLMGDDAALMADQHLRRGEDGDKEDRHAPHDADGF